MGTKKNFFPPVEKETGPSQQTEVDRTPGPLQLSSLCFKKKLTFIN
jgi:hypothetical protein